MQEADENLGVSLQQSADVHKNLRVVELFLVNIIAFAPLIYYSVSSVFFGKHLPTEEYGNSILIYLSILTQQTLAFSAFKYILFQQGRTLKDLGWSVAWRDVPASIVLFLTTIVATVIGYAILTPILPASKQALDTASQNGPSSAIVNLFSVVYLLSFVIAQILIACAYTVDEVKNLTGSKILAVLVSVILQSLVLLFAGVTAAVIFGLVALVFSIYYVTWRKILPLFLTYLYLSVLVVFITLRH